jgi:hypothetical protein
MQRAILTSLALLLFLSVFQSCEKDPGPGGKSTIYGKVLVKDYNSTFTVLNETYYGPGIWVYLIYGDDRNYGERIQTGLGGTYEFKYLRPGKYKVYALSKDSTLSTNAMIPVMLETDIPSGRQEVGLSDLVIFD